MPSPQSQKKHKRTTSVSGSPHDPNHKRFLAELQRLKAEDRKTSPRARKTSTSSASPHDLNHKRFLAELRRLVAEEAATHRLIRIERKKLRDEENRGGFTRRVAREADRQADDAQRKVDAKDDTYNPFAEDDPDWDYNYDVPSRKSRKRRRVSSKH